MRVLALDTALGATSAAIVAFPGSQLIAGRSEPMERGHAEALMPMVRDMMVEGGVDFAQIDRVVTTVGPGSFTGLRVAVAAARAMGLARAIPVVGVSTLTAYAVPFLAVNSRTSIAVAIDARHGAIFFQSFWSDGKVSVAPCILPVAEAAAMMKPGKNRTVGNAAGALATAARAIGLDCDVADAAPAPDIAWIARLGAAADPASAPALPLYLREASAIPQARAQVMRA